MSWRRANLLATVTWAIMIPIAAVLGWLQSVTFVSSISLYANVASHLAAWRADEPDQAIVERLGRIESMLDELLERAA